LKLTDVIVNGTAQRVKADTLSGLLAELGYADERIATAVDGVFVPRSQRDGRKLASGARVEIVAPRQGG